MLVHVDPAFLFLLSLAFLAIYVTWDATLMFAESPKFRQIERAGVVMQQC